jgi:hypothetical protein
MCEKGCDERRLRFLEKKLVKLSRQGKKLSDEEARELENLRNGCGGKK